MTTYRDREATPFGVCRPDKPGRWNGGDDSEDLDVFAAERYFNGDDPAWCARSWSSFSSAFRTGTTQDHDRYAAVATSSSEVSWNSRSALLPDGKLVVPTAAPSVVDASFSSAFRTGTTQEHDRSAALATSSSEVSWNSRSTLLPDGKLVVPTAAPSVVDAEPRGAAGRERMTRGKPPSQLRRWLLGVAGRACVGADGEESSSSADDECRDEVEDYNVHGTKRAGEPFQRRQSTELAIGEAAAMRVRPGRSLEVDEGSEFLAGTAALSPVQVHVHLSAEEGQRRAVNSGEFSRPVLDAATTTAALLHGQRRRSSETLRPLGDFGRSAPVSGKQNSAFTVISGNTAARPRQCISPSDINEDDASPSELGCAYPPSEASVVWSVVTAEGAASCKFSSAASGCYYHFDGRVESGATWHAAGTSRRRRRRSGVTNGGGLLTCIGDKAVNAVEPASVL